MNFILIVVITLTFFLTLYGDTVAASYNNSDATQESNTHGYKDNGEERTFPEEFAKIAENALKALRFETVSHSVKDLHKTITHLKVNPVIETLNNRHVMFIHDIFARIEDVTGLNPTQTANILKLKTKLLEQLQLAGVSSTKFFKLLGLVQGETPVSGIDFFKNKLWNTWIQYFDEFSEIKDTKTLTVYAFLKKNFSELQHSWIFKPEILRMASRCNSVVDRVQYEVKVPKFSRQRPYDVFTKFGLQKGDMQLLTIPAFDIWMKFTKKYCIANSESVSQTIYYLLTNDYSCASIARMTQEAITMESTADDIAVKLKALLIEFWAERNNEYSLSNVFVDLELDKTMNMLADPVFVTWMDYVFYHRNTHPEDNISTVKSLANLLGPDILMQTLIAAEKDPDTKAYAAFMMNELVKKLLAEKSDLSAVFEFARATKNYGGFDGFEARLFEILNEKQFTMSEVFLRLGLREAPIMIASPAFLTWSNFVDNWNKMHPEKHVSMATTVLKMLGKKDLQKAVIDALKAKTTWSNAISMGNQVLDLMLAADFAPKSVRRLTIPGICSEEFYRSYEKNIWRN